MTNNEQQWGTMDKNDQQWTTMNNNEQQGTTMNNNGQEWTTLTPKEPETTPITPTTLYNKTRKTDKRKKGPCLRQRSTWSCSPTPRTFSRKKIDCVWVVLWFFVVPNPLGVCFCMIKTWFLVVWWFLVDRIRLVFGFVEKKSISNWNLGLRSFYLSPVRVTRRGEWLKNPAFTADCTWF